MIVLPCYVTIPENSEKIIENGEEVRVVLDKKNIGLCIGDRWKNDIYEWIVTWFNNPDAAAASYHDPETLIFVAPFNGPDPAEEIEEDDEDDDEDDDGDEESDDTDDTDELDDSEPDTTND